jgi:hypothetical protein
MSDEREHTAGARACGERGHELELLDAQGALSGVWSAPGVVSAS